MNFRVFMTSSLFREQTGHCSRTRCPDYACELAELLKGAYTGSTVSREHAHIELSGRYSRRWIDRDRRTGHAVLLWQQDCEGRGAGTSARLCVS